MERRTEETYQSLYKEKLGGKSTPKISEESGIPLGTLYKKFESYKKIGKVKRAYTKRGPSLTKPLTLEMASPMTSAKIVFIVTDSSQVKKVLSEVF